MFVSQVLQLQSLLAGMGTLNFTAPFNSSVTKIKALLIQ